MSNAVIYTRISLDHHDGAGVARQEADCRDLAQRHGLNVARVYCDNSVSAYSGVRRPAFEQLLDDVRRGQVGTVVVWATDRLYRRLGDLERLATVLDDVPVLAVKSGDVDLSTADGRMHARILGTVAQHASEKQGERVAAAAQQRARSGRVTTARRPFGWQREADGSMSPHPTEGPAVVEAYDRLIRGHSLSAIARWLNEQGFTGTGGGKWTQARVSELLRIPRNGGLSRYKGEVLTDVANADGALVPADVWWTAHRIMSDPTRLKRGPGVANLISGQLAQCYKCGGAVRASSHAKRGGERILTYACKTGGHVTTPRYVLDGYVSRQVVAYLTANKDVLRQAQAQRAAAARSGDNTQATADLARLKADREGLSNLLAAGELSLAAFTSASAALDARIATLEQSLTPTSANAADRLIGARSIQRAWDGADLPTKRAVLAELIDKIVVQRIGGDRFDIHWRA